MAQLHSATSHGKGFMADPFQTTRWSIVLAAGGDAATDALETLCKIYWVPLYAYIRRRVVDEHQAQDLTQAFFERLLDKRTLASANPDRGRFRCFLLSACKHFLANERNRQNAQKHGGGIKILSLDFEDAASRYVLEPSDPLTPELLFEQQWAVALIESVLALLKQEYVQRERLAEFDVLKPFLAGSKTSGYSSAAEVLGTTEGAAKVAAHRLRNRYRELIRSEIAQTVDAPGQVEDEIRRLFEVLSEKGEKSL